MSWAKLFRGVLFLIVLALLLLYSFPQSGTIFVPERVSGARPDGPICPSLPTHGPDHQLSLFVAPTIDRPGIVCVRVYNGRPNGILYDLLSLRLERRWFGLVWSSVLHPKDLFSECRGCGVKPVGRGVAGESFSDFFLPSLYEPVHSGTYRARFRYRVAEQKEEQTVYSENFTVP
jgi:hypothetical protein